MARVVLASYTVCFPVGAVAPVEAVQARDQRQIRAVVKIAGDHFRAQTVLAKQLDDLEL